MATIDIPQHEHGHIRVFSISRPMIEMARTLRQQSKPALASLLLGHKVRVDDFELFALTDLAGVGLPDYLIDGYAINEDTIRADRTRLEALDGYVLLLFSKVSEDGSLSIHPSPDLTLIGTYGEPYAPHAATLIESDAAKPYSGLAPNAKGMRRTKVGSAITAAAAILTLVLIWWILR